MMLWPQRAQAPCGRRFKGDGLEAQAWRVPGTGNAGELVARQRLPPHDVAQFECKPLVGRETAGLQMKVPEIKDPTMLLASTMLADEAVEPAFETACESKIFTVDGEDERVLNDAS